jgi:allantoinase
MSLDATNDDVLYKLKSSTDQQNQLIILPYSMETNDISLCMSQGYTGQQYADTLIDYVEQLRSENDTRAKVVCFGLHTFIVGTPARALHFKRALETIKEMSNVCFMNCTELLELFIREK